LAAKETSEDTQQSEVVLSLLTSLNIPNPKILEVGCANGWLSRKLSRFGGVTGVDLAESVIEEAKQKAPHIEFIAGDFLTMDLPAQHFDVMIAVETMMYFDGPAFVNRAADMLKPGGHIILVCQNKFVWGRMQWAQVWIQRGSTEIMRNWVNMKGLIVLLRPMFVIRFKTTIIPDGDKGILRIANSYKVNALLRSVLSQECMNLIKKKMGLGRHLVVMAKKR
jgi:2-polyprenyl-3-methyl-5-hydroxy-6-metoxy-1,4-benzoquinol methylase